MNLNKSYNNVDIRIDDRQKNNYYFTIIMVP